MSCPLCGSGKKTVVRDRVRFGIKRKVFKCGTCHMVYLDRADKKGFYAGKTYRAAYGPKVGKKSSTKEIFNTYLPFQEPIINKLRSVLRPSMKVLDVGCSTGHFLHSLKGKVKTRVGLELGKDEVAFIRKNLDFKVYDKPIQEVSIKEGPFDLITCLQVLEHIEEPKSFLRALVANLKPGGYLYIEVPNLDDALLSLYELKEYADFYFREPHVSYFGAKTLKKALVDAGMKGRIKTVQRYNVLNHIHWLQTGKPQGDFVAGNKMPEIVKNSSKAAREINALIQRVDADYKRVLEKHGVGESLTFLGRKRA